MQTDSGERRRFERIAGHGVVATLRLAGAAPVQAVIHDLSRSGIALRHRGAGRRSDRMCRSICRTPAASWPAASSAPPTASLRIAFSETPAMLARVDRVLASLSASREAA